MTENEIAKEIVDAAYQIHVELGPGLLESVYEQVLCEELRLRGLQVERQFPIPIYWNGKKLEAGFRADILVNDKVIVELKSVEKSIPLFAKQLRSYLVLSGNKLGLLINFNVVLIKDGITRVVNGL